MASIQTSTGQRGKKEEEKEKEEATVQGGEAVVSVIASGSSVVAQTWKRPQPVPNVQAALRQ